MNVVLLRGKLSRAPEERHLASGDRLVGYEVTVQPPNGRAESVPVVWFEAPASALGLGAGTEVVVTGRVRRRFFRANGATASRTEIVADAVVRSTQRRRVAQVLEASVVTIQRHAGMGVAVAPSASGTGFGTPASSAAKMSSDTTPNEMDAQA